MCVRSKGHAYTDLLGAAGGGVRDNCIQPDRSHEQRDQSEAKKHPGDDLEKPFTLLHGLGEHGDFAQRQFLVEILHRGAHCGRGIDRGFNNQSHAVPTFLPERNEKQGPRIFLIEILNQVRGDADDRNPVAWLVVVIEAESLADRGLIRPEMLGAFMR